MDRAVANFAQMTGLPLADAWDAGSLLPWRLLEQAVAGLGRRREKGWIIAQAAPGALQVRATWRGKRVLWLEG